MDAVEGVALAKEWGQGPVDRQLTTSDVKYESKIWQ